MEVDPKKRLGKGGGHELLNHPFFSSIHWPTLQAGKLPSPLMDQVNLKMGSGTLRPAANGTRPGHWKMAQDHRSPRYTTRWDELPRTR